MNLLQTTYLNPNQKQQLLYLWNSEYPEKLAYNNVAALEQYLEKLENVHHVLLVDDNENVLGWAFTFDRESARWFAIIVSKTLQGKGYGKQLMEHLQRRETELNGWVIDHNRDVKSDGEVYISPLEFYLKCGFISIPDERLEMNIISAVRINWNNQKLNPAQ